jgi:tRNA (guanine37-N1)-methyltransferase
MKIDILTLFPEMIEGFCSASILGKAQEKGIVQLKAHNFRAYSENKHGSVDDYPYGGGGGMVLTPQPIFSAVEYLLSQKLPVTERQSKIILLCPQGEPYHQRKAEELSREKHLILVCGHYEGVDERIREHLITDEISLGDYVLTGGEIAACAIIDSVVRLLPGALGNESSSMTDSFSNGLLEYPQYTRPAKFGEWQVPEILLSGHHDNINKWRRQQSLFRTWQRRPDLLLDLNLTVEERGWIADLEKGCNK